MVLPALIYYYNINFHLHCFHETDPLIISDASLFKIASILKGTSKRADRPTRSTGNRARYSWTSWYTDLPTGPNELDCIRHDQDKQWNWTASNMIRTKGQKKKQDEQRI